MFEINPTKWYKLTNEQIMSKNGTVPLVSNSSIDNGVMGFSSLEANNSGNSISCSDTTLGADTMYYQKDDFIGYQHIQHLVSKFLPFNQEIALYIISACRVATSNAGYDYGHKFNRDAMNSTIIHLPQTNDGEIDFDFMESFIREIEEKNMRKLSAYLATTGLSDYTLTNAERSALKSFDDMQWEEFRMGNLFDRVGTKKLPYKAGELPKEPVAEYTLPCLTSSFNNQGLNYYASREGATILKNVITIPSNSDVYRAYYQSRDFTVLSDAYAIKWIFDNKDMDSKQYLFVVPCINMVTDLSIYSYKNKLGGWNVVKDKFILLPVKDGKPDYDTMDTFISAIQKLVIKDVVLYANKKIASV
ncbi:MAG: restriction endonuclease subunit S [Bacteroidaceae bacterium]|nr:restriction endonuclease subunit S [Bacteroidaceae bacterium]